MDGHGLCLRHAVHASDGLYFDGWVHGRLHQEDMVGGRQVDPDRTSALREQKDGAFRVLLKHLEHLVPANV